MCKNISPRPDIISESLSPSLANTYSRIGKQTGDGCVFTAKDCNRYQKVIFYHPCSAPIFLFSFFSRCQLFASSFLSSPTPDRYLCNARGECCKPLWPNCCRLYLSAVFRIPLQFIHLRIFCICAVQILYGVIDLILQ